MGHLSVFVKSVNNVSNFIEQICCETNCFSCSKKNSSPFMGLKHSSALLQEPATEPFPKPDESSLHSHLLLL
jgi:hypothetical protein